MAIKLSDIDPGDIIEKDVFQLLGLEGSSEEDKKKVIDDMLETIQNRVVARLHDSLSEEDRSELERLNEAGNDDVVNQFLKARGIDINQITAEEALFYKTEILGISKP